MPSGKPFVGPSENKCARDPGLEGRANLPGKDAPLFFLPLTHRIDAEFGQHKGLIDGEIMQARDVSAKRRCVVKVDVKTDEIGEVDRQIFSRWEVGVTNQCFRMFILDAGDEAFDEAAHGLTAVPAYYVRRDLVADEIAQDGGVPVTIVHPGGYHCPDLSLRLRTVEKCDVLRPGQSDEYLQTGPMSGVEQPQTRRGKDTH